jgi:hypothetical protein
MPFHVHHSSLCNEPAQKTVDWRSALIAAQRLRESALGEITISDQAAECGNRLIGNACSAHLRNSRTNRKPMVFLKAAAFQRFTLGRSG